MNPRVYYGLAPPCSQLVGRNDAIGPGRGKKEVAAASPEAAAEWFTLSAAEWARSGKLDGYVACRDRDITARAEDIAYWAHGRFDDQSGELVLHRVRHVGEVIDREKHLVTWAQVVRVRHGGDPIHLPPDPPTGAAEGHAAGAHGRIREDIDAVDIDMDIERLTGVVYRQPEVSGISLCRTTTCGERKGSEVLEADEIDGSTTVSGDLRALRGARASEQAKSQRQAGDNGDHEVPYFLRLFLEWGTGQGSTRIP